MNKTANVFTSFLIFIGLALMYCIWPMGSFLMGSIGGTLMLAIVALTVDLWVNYVFDTPYYILMFASLAPALVYLVLFNFNPAYSYADGTFCTLILVAFRILISAFESLKRKKYAFIPLSVVLSAIVLYLAFSVNEYQYDVLHELGIFAPK